MRPHSNSIAGIVFSKDRAMQLDAFLRSFFSHCMDANRISLKVLYTGSSDIFLAQYRKLAAEYSMVEFILQNEFKQDVLCLLDIPTSFLGRFFFRKKAANSKKYVLFLVDDNIFVGDFSFSQIVEALDREEKALGFSLQLGENINYCYPLDISLCFPAHESVFADIIRYSWPEAGEGLNYPLDVSSSVYRWSEMAMLLPSLAFSNPNILEAQMAARANYYRDTHPYLLSYKQSVTFCNPVNKVQSIYGNKSGNKLEYTPEAFSQLFDEGYRIDLRPFREMIPGAAHQLIDITFTGK